MTNSYMFGYNGHGSPKPANFDNLNFGSAARRIGDQMELIAYVRFWLDNVKKTKVKPATFDRLVTSADALEDFAIAHKQIRSITAADCEDYVSEITNKGYALTTIKKQMLIVSAPLRYAYAHNQISYNPSVDLKPPSKANVQKQKKQIVAYNQEEQNQLRAVLKTRKHDSYAAIDLMIETGLRPGEALALDWDDIQLERRRLHVCKTVVNLANKRCSYVQNSPKSETSERQVPLSLYAVELLSSLRDEKKTDCLFSDGNGNRLSYEALRYQCQAVCKKAGVKYYGLHVFRHTFATNQFYKGTNVKILSQILGHSETSVTYNIYIHLYGDGFEDMLNAVS